MGTMSFDYRAKAQQMQNVKIILDTLSCQPIQSLGTICYYMYMDETWVHHYQPETKEQSTVEAFHVTPVPRKAKVTPSAGKVIASVFWDAQVL